MTEQFSRLEFMMARNDKNKSISKIKKLKQIRFEETKH